MDRHYIGSVTSTTHQEKSIITIESNPSRGTVLPAPYGKGNKCDKKVKYKKKLMHRHCGTNNRAPRWIFTGPLQTRGETRCPGGVSVSCLASRTRHDCPQRNESVYMEAWHWMLTDTLRKCHSHNTHWKRHNNTWVESLAGNCTTSSTRQREQVWQKCKIQKNWCTVTVARTIEHHGGYSRTPANQRWHQVPGRSQRLLFS